MRFMLTIMMMGWAATLAASQVEEHRLRVGGVERWTTTVVPESYRPGAPVLLLLHGGGQSMRKILAENSGGTRHWLEIAEREGFLLLVPNASNASNGDPKGDKQNWNDLRPASAKSKSSADDVGFLMQLLNWAHDQYRYDRQRVYVTGANGLPLPLRLSHRCLWNRRRCPRQEGACR